ncbi:hypothetical protein Hypma_003707 [Hypsizygus marmoreus]|uniref:Protein kinase domain-containing protein n=1 Tax=Hypsizygus marmoreus TaxID=39966 RepID=A0A369J1A3_HYPMA|nr:hypothetical protein Hypma_003707 [Hypsizygus marmoreus]
MANQDEQSLAISHQKYVFRLQSNGPPDDKSPMTRAVLDSHLTRDLMNRQSQHTPFLTELLTVEQTDFGFDLNRWFIRELLEITPGLLDSYMQLHYKLLHNEETAAFYLNTIISTVAKWFENHPLADDGPVRKPLRYFSAGKKNKAIFATISHKPDLLLLPLLDGHLLDSNQVTWSDVYSVFEVTSSNCFTALMQRTLNTKRFLMGLHQGDRLYCPAMSIHDKRFRFMVSDYEGDVQTPLMTFGTDEGTKNFLRAVIGLAFLDAKRIGLDHTMVRRDTVSSKVGPHSFHTLYPCTPDAAIPWEDPEEFAKWVAASHNGDSGSIHLPSRIFTSTSNNQGHEQLTVLDNDEIIGREVNAQSGYIVGDFADEDCGITSVTCLGEIYIVLKELFRSRSLIRHGTRVWLVLTPAKTYAIMKESWIDKGQSSEADFLESLDIPNGIRVIASEVVQDTNHYRIDIPWVQRMTTAREKCRVIIEPAGYHISTFKSVFELLVIAKDIVHAIDYLASKGKVHRNISFDNILLRDTIPGDELAEDDSVEAVVVAHYRNHLKCHRGLLVDYNHAGNINDPSQIGTAPFTAIEVLYGNDRKHTVAHDLESLFNVLLIISVHLPTFGDSRHAHGLVFHPNDRSPIADWFKPRPCPVLADIKGGQFYMFEDRVFPHVLEQFQLLKKPLKQLYDVLFGYKLAGDGNWTSTVTCQQFIEILNKAILDPEIIADAKRRHNSTDNHTMSRETTGGESMSSGSGSNSRKRSREHRQEDPRPRTRTSGGTSAQPIQA